MTDKGELELIETLEKCRVFHPYLRLEILSPYEGSWNVFIYNKKMKAIVALSGENKDEVLMKAKEELKLEFEELL